MSDQGGTRIQLDIYHHLPIFTIIYHHLPSFTIIYHHLPSFTIIYHHLPSSTIIYHHLPSFTIIYHHLPSFTIIYHHLPSFTIIYHHLPSFTIIYHHLPSFTIIYHHLPSFPIISIFYPLWMVKYKVWPSAESNRAEVTCLLWNSWDWYWAGGNGGEIFRIRFWWRLVGGLEHFLFSYIYIYVYIYILLYIGNNNPNWRTHIFQRGRYNTNQEDVRSYAVSRWHDSCVVPMGSACTPVLATSKKIRLKIRYATVCHIPPITDGLNHWWSAYHGFRHVPNTHTHIS